MITVFNEALGGELWMRWAGYGGLTLTMTDIILLHSPNAAVSKLGVSDTSASSPTHLPSIRGRYGSIAEAAVLGHGLERPLPGGALLFPRDIRLPLDTARPGVLSQQQQSVHPVGGCRGFPSAEACGQELYGGGDTVLLCLSLGGGPGAAPTQASSVTPSLPVFYLLRSRALACALGLVGSFPRRL
jgi:hypothetical protein